MSPGDSVTVINPNARKSLRLFTGVLDVKNKTDVRQVGAAKSKRKAIRSDSTLGLIIPQKRVYKKITERVKKYLYNFILQHPQVVQYPIANYCLKVSIISHSEP